MKKKQYHLKQQFVVSKESTKQEMKSLFHE